MSARDEARALLEKPTVVAQVWEARTVVKELLAEADAAAALAHAVETAHGPNRDHVVNAALNDYWRTVGVEP